MKLNYLIAIACLSATAVSIGSTLALASEKIADKDADKNFSLKNTSDENLVEQAQKELELPASASLEKSDTASGATVSVADIIAAAEDPYARSHWEAELLGQQFSPRGNGTLSNGEKFALDNLPRKLLVGMSAQYWFQPYSEFVGRNWRFGLQGSLLGSSQEINVTSSSGFQFRGIRLFDFYAGSGPQAEILVPFTKRILILGAGLRVGQMLRMQSNANTVANSVNTAWWYGPEAYLRGEISRTIFIRAAYTTRDILGESSIATQNNNFLLSIGFAI